MVYLTEALLTVGRAEAGSGHRYSDTIAYISSDQKGHWMS